MCEYHTDSLVSRLRALVLQLDRIGDKMESQQSTVSKQTKQTATVGGRKAKQASKNMDPEGT